MSTYSVSPNYKAAFGEAALILQWVPSVSPDYKGAHVAVFGSVVLYGVAC